MIVEIALGLVLGTITLGVLRVVIDHGTAPSEGRKPKPPSQRELRRRAKLQAKLAGGPCYIDGRHVRQGVRHWDWR